MERIDQYVNELIHEVYGDRATELEDLRQEITSHLKEAALELQQQGNSLADSISIAIERFGDREMLISEMGHLYGKSQQPMNLVGPNRKISIAIKIIATLYLLLASWAIVVCLIVVFPSIAGSESFTIGAKIAVIAYLPYVIFFPLAGVGLWLSKRWGWYAAVFICLSSLYSQIRSLIDWPEQIREIIQKPNPDTDFLLFYVNSFSWWQWLLKLVIVIAGLWFYMLPSVHTRFRPVGSRWKAVIVLTLAVLAYTYLSSLSIRYIIGG